MRAGVEEFISKYGFSDSPTFPLTNHCPELTPLAFPTPGRTQDRVC